MRFAPLLVVAGLALSGCGKEIGDACNLDSECDPNGQRRCDSSQREGYCTIQGCDYNTCPEDSACIRFFTGGFDNFPCDPANEDKPPESPAADDCSLDELCSLTNVCVPRSSESRYCMATCGDDGDCRDGYECRDLDLMKLHGGEPVVQSGTAITNTKFCAEKPLL